MEVVPLLELPDPLARIAGVVPRRDRPQGVGRLDDIADRLSGAPGRMSREPHHEGDHQDEDGNPANMCSHVSEQVFALSRVARA